jgi:hypothetical protein
MAIAATAATVTEKKRLRRERAKRAAARREAVARKMRVFERLTSGVSAGHIAHAEKITVRRVRQIITEGLARREFDPPAGFVQIQIARLSDAMIVAHTKMMEGDLPAMDRLIRLVNELERYNGLFHSQRENPPRSRVAASAPKLSLPAPK